MSSEHDPFRTPPASPALRRPLAMAGFTLGILALVVVPVATGVLGMVFGLVAHLKGERLGFPAAAVAAVGMILGMSLELFLAA